MAQFCTIARDQNNEIQEVYAPNENPSVLYKDILEALGGAFSEKEEALTIWARAYTQNFKDKFGDWELISEARKYVDKVAGDINKSVLKNDPQRTLFPLQGACF